MAPFLVLINLISSIKNRKISKCTETVTGSTAGLTSQVVPTCVTALNTGGGHWYTTQGTGGLVTITTCNPVTNYDTKLGIFTGTCAALTCVTGNDDGSPGGGTDPACFSVAGITVNRASTVMFTSVAGTTYHIYVTGFLTATNAAHTSRQLSAPKNNYVRISRFGDVFTSAVSSNGTTWTQVNSTTVAGLPAAMQVGFFVNSQLASLGSVNFGLATVATGTPAATGDISSGGKIGDEILDVILYPNPVSSDINIKMNSLSGLPVEINIFNVLGQLVYNERNDSASEIETISVSNLKTGIYMLQVNNNPPIKFVVEK